MSNRTVYFDPDDDVWKNKRNDATRATSRHATRKEAVDRARAGLRKSGGGELTVQNKGNKLIGQKDSVPPGNDPFPPPG